MHALHATLFLPNLTALILENMFLSTGAARAFATALSCMTLPSLVILNLQFFRIPINGDEGLYGRDMACKLLEVVEKLPDLPSLQVLHLSNRGQVAMDDYHRPNSGPMHMQESVAGGQRFGRGVVAVLSSVVRLRVCFLALHHAWFFSAHRSCGDCVASIASVLSMLVRSSYEEP